MSTAALNASIITIGDELLIGQTIDTNSSYISRRLNAMGIWVQRRVAIGDDWNDIWQTLQEESQRSSIIIITGGLGPTADDITKPLLAQYFGGTLMLNEAVLEHVTNLLTTVMGRSGAILERNRKQAEVPDNAIVLHNAVGTAPGMLFKKNNVYFFSLPGVPFEMRYLMENEVLPRIKANFTLPAIAHRTALTFGVGESMLAELLVSFEQQLPSYIRLAYLPDYGMIRLRLTAHGSDLPQLNLAIDNAFSALKELTKDYLVHDKDETIPVITANLLTAKNYTMGTIESCTGGLIAQLITGIAGSSVFYKGSIVSYANEAKTNLVMVRPSTLQSHGAVSEATIKEMVAGGLKQLKTDYIVATSGIMGPGGATPEKPVGMVWIGVGREGKILTFLHQLRYDRERNIRQTAFIALNHLRRFITEDNN